MAFISYDDYKNRIEKLAKFKNFVDKYKFLIIGVLAVIIAGASALMATKGMITSDMSLSSGTYTYGDSFTPTSASAFLSDIGYEYTVRGENEWTSQKPVKVGKYSVRAVSNKLIGKGYGTPVDFEILPAKIEFAFTNSETATLTYGSDPIDYTYKGLVTALGDKIASDGVIFDYDYPDAVGGDVNVTLNKLEIKAGNEDRSDCYVYDTPSTTYKFAAKPVTFKLDDASEIYNGKGFTVNGKPDANTQNQLVGKDSYKVSTQISNGITPVNADDYVIELNGDPQVFDANGKEITYRYIFSSKSNGKFTINKRPVTFQSETKSWTYDGEAHSYDKFTTASGSVADGQTVTATALTSVTDVWDGKRANELEYVICDASNNPVTSNYSITTRTGTIEITRREVSVTLNDIPDVIYGNAVNYTSGGETIVNAIGECTVGVNSGNLQYSPLGNYFYPNAGAYKVLCGGNDITIFSGGRDVSGNYSVTTVNGGTLTINARSITVTLNNMNPVEYGEPLPAPSYTIGGEGLASGETFNGAYLYNGEEATLLNTGTYTVSVDRANCGFTRYGTAVPSSNYTITAVTDTSLTVTSRAVTVYLKDMQVKYGDAISYTGGYKSVNNLAVGQTVSVDSSKVIMPTGTPDAGDSYVINYTDGVVSILNGGTDVTTNYTVSVMEGTLEITPRPITVKAKDILGVIYGEKAEYEIKEGNYANTPDLVAGEKLTINNVSYNIFQGVTPDVGEYKITPDIDDITIVKANGSSSSGNYTITPDTGKLEIVKRPVRIVSDDNHEFIYNGLPQYEKGYDIKLDNPNYFDVLSIHTVVVTQSTPVTDVGAAVPNIQTYKITTQSGADKSENYQIYAYSGSLMVNPRPIEVTLKTYSAVYGNSYAYPTGAGNYENTPDLASGDSLEITAVTYPFDTSGHPDVDTYTISKSGFKITKANGADSKGNYTVTWNDGSLSITARPIEVTLKTYSAVYGDSYAYPTGAGNYENTPDLASGDKLEITAVTYPFDTSGHPGVDTYTISKSGYTITKAGGADGKGNYDVSWNDGSLTITARPVTVTLNDIASVTYGEEVVYGGGYKSTTGVLTGHTVSVNATADDMTFNPSATYPNAGKYTFACDGNKISISDGSGDVTENYSVTVTAGNLEITKRAITVQLNKYGATYGDGYAYETGAGNYDKTVLPDLVGGDTLEITAVTYPFDTSRHPDVDTYTVSQANYTITKANGADSKGNYTVTWKDGELEITSRPIEVTLKTYSAVYGDSYAYPTDAGNYENTPDLASGDILQISEVTYEFGNAQYPAVGTYKVSQANYTITKAGGADGKGNYDVSWNDGSLTITARPVTVYLKDITSVYGETVTYVAGKEATEKVLKEHTVTVSATADDMTFSPLGNHSYPNAGKYTFTCNNSFISIFDGSTPVTDNYEIEVIEGTLTITARPVTVQLYSNEVYYGAPHDYVALRGGAYEDITDGSLATFDGNTHTLTITGVEYEFGSAQYPDARATAYAVTEVEYQITTVGGMVIDADNYKITFTGALTVTKRPIIVNIEDTECLYGASELPTPTFTVTGVEDENGVIQKGFINDDRLAVSSFVRTNKDGVVPQYFDAGEYTVSLGDGYKFTDKDGNFLSVNNYEITDCNTGTLTINKREVTVTVNPLTYGYGVLAGSDIVWSNRDDTANPAHLEIQGNLKDLIELGGDGLSDNSQIFTVHFKPYDLLTGDYVECKNVGTYGWTVSSIWGILPGDKAVGSWYYETKPALSDGYESKNYVFKIETTSTLEITQKDLTVNLGNITAEYGEDPFDGYSVENVTKGLEFNETLSIFKFFAEKDGVKVTVQYPDAGSYKINADEKDAYIYDEKSFYPIYEGYKNYAITFDGNLTVTPRTVTVTFNSTGADYGDVIEYKGATYTGQLEGHDVVVDGDKVLKPYQGLNANTYTLAVNDNTKSAITVWDGEKDVTKNYDFDIKGNSEFVVISKRKITVKPTSYSVEYGKNFNYSTNADPNYDKITSGSLATFDGEEETLYIFVYSLEVDGYVKKDVGFYPFVPNDYTVTKVDGKTDSTNNYTVEYEEGTLEITQKTVEVELKDKIYTYGEAGYVNKSYAKLYSEFIGDVKVSDVETVRLVFSFTQNGEPVEPRNAGDYKVVVEGAVTENYIITPTGEATLTINPRQLHPVPDGNSAVYGTTATELVYRSGADNYTELFADKYYNFPAYGEAVEIFVSYDLGGQDLPSAGFYNAVLTGVTVHYPDPDVPSENGVADEGLFRTTNYTIFINEEQFANKLEITKKAVTVTLNDISAYYGDTIEYVSDGTEEADGLLTQFGHVLSIDPAGVSFAQNGVPVEPENVGTYSIVTSSDNSFINIMSGDDVTGNYNITVASGGTLTISALTVTVTLQYVTDTVIYGEPLPELEISGLIKGDTISGGLIYNFDDNSGYMTSEWLNGGVNRYLNAGGYVVDLAENYQITYKNGAPSTTKNYDIQSVITADLKIIPRTVTVSLKGFEREYGDNNSDELIWEKNGNTAGWAYISDMDIGNLISIDNLAEGEGVYSLTLSVYEKNTDNTVVCRDATTYDVALKELSIHYFAGNKQSAENYAYSLPERVTLTVNPKAVEVDLGEQEFTYGEEEEFRAEFAFSTGKDLAFNETLDLATFFAVKDGMVVADRLNAGDYLLDADEEATAFSDRYGDPIENGWKNYELTFTGSLKVTRKSIDITLLGIDVEGGFYYGGEAKPAYPSYQGNFLNTPELVYGETLQIAVAFYDKDGETVDGTPVNAGTYYYSFVKEGSVVTGGNADIENYDIKCVSKTVTVNPFEISIDVVSDTKIYDGEAYVYNPTSYTTDKELPNGESLIISVTFEDKNGNPVTDPTDAGTYFIYFKEITEVIPGSNPDTVVDNYAVKYRYWEDEGVVLPGVDVEPGADVVEPVAVHTLEITKRNITIGVVENQKFIYSVEDVLPEFTAIGFPQDGVDEGRIQASPTGWEYSVDGEEWFDGGDIALNGIVLAEGVYFVRFTQATVTYDYWDTIDEIGKNHEVDYEIGTIEVISCEVRVVTNSNTFVYNGEEQYDNGYTLYYKNAEGEWTEFTLPEDEVILGDYTKVKDVCTEEDNVIDITIPNYNIVETVPGKLTVTARTITINTYDTEWIYDGGAHFVTEDYDIDDIIVKHEYKTAHVNEIIDKGEEVNEIAITDILDENGDSVKNNYNIETNYGWLIVTARPIVVITGTEGEKSKEYDGTPLVNESYSTYYFNDPEEKGLLNDGDFLTADDDYEKMIRVGEDVENKVTFTPSSENYEIVGYEQCTLTITARHISIALIGNPSLIYGEETYGSEYGNFTWVNGSLADGDELKVAVKYVLEGESLTDAKTSVRNVGTYTLYLDESRSVVQTSYDYENGLSNYVIDDCATAQITISEKHITVTLNGLDDKVYGESFAGYGEYAGNYEDLSDDLAYTDALKVAVEYYDLNDGSDIVIDEETDADTYGVRLSSYTVYGKDGEDISGNYVIVAAGDVTLTVVPRPIFVHTGSAIKNEYDGTALYSPESKADYEVRVYYKNSVDDTPDGLVNGHTAEEVLALDINSIKSIVNAGTIDNDVSYILLATRNYKLSVDGFVYGTLTVIAKTVNISLYEFKKADEELYYYGEGEDLVYEQKFGNFDTDEELANGEQVQIAISWQYLGADVSVPLNAGIYNYQIDKEHSVVKGADGNVIADGIYNYNFSYELGEVEIYPLQIEITVSDCSKTYDGTAYVYDATDYITDIGLRYEESLKISVSYTDEDGNPVSNPTDAGIYYVYFNAITEVVAGSNGDAVPANYAPVSNSHSILTISKRTVTVTVEDGEFAYWIDDVIIQYTPDNLPDGASVEALSYRYKTENDEDWTAGIPSDAGVYAVEVTEITLSENGTPVDYSANYNVAYEAGTITIVELELYLKTYDGVFEYDGTEHYETRFKLYRDADLTQEVEVKVEVEDTFKTPITNVSESGKENIVKYDFTDTNYKVPDTNYSYGTLTVNKRQLIIESNSSTDDEKWTYNGEAKYDTGFEVISVNNVVEGHKIEVDDYPTVTFATEGDVINELFYKIVDENDSTIDFSDNYQIEKVNGTLRVNKREITVHLNDITGDFYYGNTVAYDGGYATEPDLPDLVRDEVLTVGVMYWDEDGNYYDVPKNAGVYFYGFDLDSTTIVSPVHGEVTDNYEITCTDEKSFRIKQLSVSITLDEWASEEYSGEAFEYPCRYTVTDGGFADGEELDLKVKYRIKDGDEISELIDAGDYTVIYDDENSTIGGISPTINYQIIILPEDGISFTITPKNIKIIMGDESREYNGQVYDYLTEFTEQFVVQAANGENNVLDTIIPTEVIYEDGVSKNVGTYKVALAEDGFDVVGGKKSNYNLVIEGSKLSCEAEITRRDITFNIDDWSIETGEEVVPPYTVGGSGFVDGDELTPEFVVKDGEGNLIPIGEFEFARGTYEISVKFTDEDGVLGNYSTAYNNGTLEVTARKVTVTPIYSGGEFTYDGDAINLEGLLVYEHIHTTVPSQPGFINGVVPTHKFVFTDEYGNRIESPNTPVNAGKYTVTVEFIDANDDDYLITFGEDAEIIINKRPVTVTLTGYSESKLDGYLQYNNSQFPKAETLFTSVSVSNIVDSETSTSTVSLYYFNFDFTEYKVGDGKFTRNYAGDYQILADVVKGGKVDTNYRVASITEITFTVKQAPLYVTPISKTDVEYTHEGQTLELTDYKIWEEYGVLYGSDTLTIEGSGVLKTTSSMDVIIKSVTIMQNGMNVTYAYDVHRKAEKDSPVAPEEFRATLSFKTIDVALYQPEPTVKEFRYDGTNHATELGVSLSGVYVDESKIIHTGYSIDIKLIPIRNIGEYDTWVQIIVRDRDGKNITSLYNFIPNPESKVVVYANDLDLNVSLTDEQLENAWDNRGTGILSESVQYGDNVYYVLGGSYTVSGLQSGHACKVLVREEGGALALKVIVFDENTNAERSTIYTLNATADGTAYSVTLTPMALLRRPDTTTTTQAETSASIGGNEQ